MVHKGWAHKFPSWEGLADFLGTDQIALSKFALITKTKPDGTLKHRLIWDLLRSGVNGCIRQGERIVLPRLTDLIRDAHELMTAASFADEVALFGTDVADAFTRSPCAPTNVVSYAPALADAFTRSA